MNRIIAIVPGSSAACYTIDGFLFLFVARGGLHGGAAPVVDEAVASALPRGGQVRPGASPAGESFWNGWGGLPVRPSTQS